MPKPNNDWNTTKRRLHNYQDHTGDWEADFEDLDLDLPSGRKAWYAGLNVKTLLASILI